MTDDEFTASNGYKVLRLRDGQVCITRPIPGASYEYTNWFTPAEAQAHAEFLATGLVRPVAEPTTRKLDPYPYKSAIGAHRTREEMIIPVAFKPDPQYEQSEAAYTEGNETP